MNAAKLNLIMHVRPGTGDYALEGRGLAVVRIEPPFAAVILNRMLLAGRNKKYDESFLETYYWDNSCDYFEEVKDHKLLDSDHFANEEWDRVDDKQLGTIKKQGARVEVAQMVVSEEDVGWTAVVKHTDIYIVTPRIDKMVIMDLARPTKKRRPSRAR